MHDRDRILAEKNMVERPTLDPQPQSTRSESQHRPKRERMIVMTLLAVMGGLLAMDALLLSKLM